MKWIKKDHSIQVVLGGGLIVGGVHWSIVGSWYEGYVNNFRLKNQFNNENEACEAVEKLIRSRLKDIQKEIENE